MIYFRLQLFPPTFISMWTMEFSMTMSSGGPHSQYKKLMPCWRDPSLWQAGKWNWETSTQSQGKAKECLRLRHNPAACHAKGSLEADGDAFCQWSSGEGCAGYRDFSSLPYLLWLAPQWNNGGSWHRGTCCVIYLHVPTGGARARDVPFKWTAIRSG